MAKHETLVSHVKETIADMRKDGPLTRNERRKIARARKLLKSIRIDRAMEAKREDVKREIVKDNLSSPIERNYYPQSNMSKFAGSSHRGYVTQATGSMSKRSTITVMSKKANREKSYDTYARPKEATPHDWKIRED